MISYLVLKLFRLVDCRIVRLQQHSPHNMKFSINIENFIFSTEQFYLVPEFLILGGTENT